MRYRKAEDVLPADLLKEVQKYVDGEGEALYFPRRGKRRQWGEGSGARDFYRSRNRDMKERFAQGQAVELLAEQYGLSVESVRKIVYQT